MTDTTAVKSLITPQDQTLRTVFNAQRSYYIDIYQREYKWLEKDVKLLLNDIELRFMQHELRKTSPKEIQEDVLDRFEPYFLNTYLTHKTAQNTSIVDGQQRLTTLLLILIRLYRVIKEIEDDSRNEGYVKGRTFSSAIIEQLIYEADDFGEAKRFKIFNENREEAFRALVQNTQVISSTETGRRIDENYITISKYFDKFLRDEAGKYDLAKITYYITYLLDRISIVEIRIERQENVAMIFEVVNDRGVKLKPYEILKGKLIGLLNGRQREEANAVWTDLQEQYFRAEIRNSTEKSIDLDTFFRAFFRAKFADTEVEYERFEGAYHYQLHSNKAVRKYFGDLKDKEVLFKRITKDLKYFAELYLELRAGYDHESVIFNKLLDQNQQYLLIIANVLLDDPDRAKKIEGVAKKFDQMHVVLRLLNSYDSNEFQRLVYPLFAAVRDKDLESAVAVLDRALLLTLEEKGGISKDQHQAVAELFVYDRFKEVANKWTNFSKYILMRIDRYLFHVLGKPSYASVALKELEDQFNKNGNRRYGMHLEHMYTQHEKNKALFTAGKLFDENAFNRTRNLLGMVLLLKDSHNLSSNDDIYSKKVDTYSKSDLIWNELLVGHLQQIDYRELPPELRSLQIEPNVDGVFPLEKVDERQRAIFEAIKAIWGNL